MKHQLGNAPHTMIGSPTTKTIPQSMRPEPDPGNAPQS